MSLEFERIGTKSYRQPMAMIANSFIVQPITEPNEQSDRCRWVLDPPFQRGSVWTLEQKVAWIETMLRGLGIPALIINEFPKKHPVYGYNPIVIDGQQRLRATAEFLMDEFKVRGELWSEQSKPFQRGFIMTQAICATVYCAFETDRECAELYLKLLEAGTAHTELEMESARAYLEKCDA